ncbi:MAG TPA: choice-of-anchor V domain-containing protein [Candidatus Acidoferrales bacterium]|nr:choice-of-anchor V domain-containing protein [Candidatus Acidoferrales bacterium]
MRKHTTRISRFTLTAALGASAAWAYPFGPPNGYTPAPGDKPGIACTQCHIGTPLNGGGGSVRVAFTNGLTYAPGQAQTLNVTIADGVAAVYGFEMTARLDSGPNTQQAGSFTAGQNQKVICSDNAVQPAGGCGGNGIQWIEHTQPSLSNTISVQWTAPPAGSGNVHLYVAANAGNGDNTFRGDHIYTADYVLTPASTATTGVPAVTGIVNAASGAPGAEAGSWITITGTNFAASATTWDNLIVANVYPTTVGGVTVAIDGRPAPISFVNQTQINALVPATSTLGNVSVVVSNGAGSGAAATLALAAAAPGLFTFQQNQGRYPAAVVLDGANSFEYLAPPGMLGSGSQSRAAKAGDSIILYGTAFGPTTTPLSPSMSANVAYPLAHSGPDITQPLAQVTIGGQAAQLQFCGIVSPGVYQVNAVVPSGLAGGDQPLKVTLLSGPSSAQTLFIPVQ